MVSKGKAFGRDVTLGAGKKIGFVLRDPKLNCVQLPGPGEKRRNALFVQSAKSRLNFLLNFTFVLRDMKLNKVQFPQFVPGFCERKVP